MGKDYYVFSYGSNMLFQRIFERVNTVEVVGTYVLQGYRLRFNKKSIDGSTKANIQATDDAGDAVCGVLHRLSLSQKPILDQYEALGQGYDLQHFLMTTSGGGQLRIHYYVATEPQYLTVGQPYRWYLNFVIAGAMENGFPNPYINELKAITPMTDKNQIRKHQNDAVLQRSKVPWP